jgi:hypothetical protein
MVRDDNLGMKYCDGGKCRGYAQNIELKICTFL